MVYATLKDCLTVGFNGVICYNLLVGRLVPRRSSCLSLRGQAAPAHSYAKRS